MKEKFKKGILNKKEFWIALSFLVCIIILLCTNMGLISENVNRIFRFITYRFGGLYISSYVLSILFCLYLIFGKYKDVVLGGNDQKPEYSLFSWGSMLFCTFIGTVTVMGFAEPLYYLIDPPLGIKPMSEEAYEMAHMYGQFHWGFTAISFFVPATVLVTYYIYIQKGKKIGLGDVLNSNGMCNRGFSTFVNVISIVAIVGAISTSMGLGSPLIGRIIEGLIPVGNSTLMIILVHAVMFLIFSISVWKGLDKGIKKLSQFNIVYVFCLMIIFAIIANPFSILDAQINSIGLYLQNIVRMSFTTDPFGTSKFPQRWTVFYWAWYLAYVPLSSIFTARISKGRTIRQLAAGMLIFGALGSMIIFGVEGYYSLFLQSEGIVDIVSVLELHGKDEAIYTILQTLPWSGLLSVLYALSIVVFLSTTVDSGAYVLSMVSTNSINEQQPPRRLRLLWAVILLVISLLLSLIGGLETMQIASILAGAPMIIIQVIIILALWKILRRGENGAKTNKLESNNTDEQE